MASEPEGFYRETIRAGYRSVYLSRLASMVARVVDNDVAQVVVTQTNGNTAVAESWTGTQFDAHVVAAFERVLDA